MNNSTYAARVLSGFEFASCDEQLELIRKRNAARRAKSPELDRIFRKSEAPPAPTSEPEPIFATMQAPEPKSVRKPSADDVEVLELCRRFDDAVVNNLAGRNSDTVRMTPFDAWRSAASWIERKVDASDLSPELCELVGMHVMDARPQRPALNMGSALKLLNRMTGGNLERYAAQARSEGKSFDHDRAWPAAHRGGVSKVIGIVLNEHKDGKTSAVQAANLLLWCEAKVEETYANNIEGRRKAVAWFAHVLRDMSERVGIAMPDLIGPKAPSAPAPAPAKKANAA